MVLSVVSLPALVLLALWWGRGLSDISCSLCIIALFVLCALREKEK